MALSFSIKSLDQIRADYLRTLSNGYRKLNIANPDVGPGTAAYLDATAIAQQVSALYYALAKQDENRLPDTVTGEELDRYAKLYNLFRQPASASAGFINFQTNITAAVLIPQGSALLDNKSQQFIVSVGGTYNPGDRVPVVSVPTGSGTNLPAGSLLKWLSPPPNCNSRATVATGGLIGGSDAELDGSLQTRLQNVIRTKPGNHNWADLCTIIEGADPLVQKGFCYPAYVGPASVLVVAARAQTDSNKNRSITDPVVLNTLTATVLGNFPAWADINVMTVADQTANVSIGLSLSEAQWVDSQPFPSYATDGYCKVTATASSTSITLKSDRAPVTGVSHVAWLDPSTWEVKRAKVTAFVDNGSSSYTLTLDLPFTGIAIGQLVMPDAIRLEDYVDSVLESFGQLGPGEMANPSIHPGLFPRAYRKPLPSAAYPSQLGSQVLRALSTSQAEVLDAQFLFRSKINPDYPATFADEPNILVPNLIGFYPLS